MNVNCVGIDVSIITVIRPLGEIAIPPFEVGHTNAELCELSGLLRKLDGEIRVVVEATGNYHLPIASFLYDSDFYVSVAMLVHGYGNNSLRRAKTDKKDAIKLVNYDLDHWLALPKYIPEDEVRLMLKTTYRQYQQCAKVQTMLKNNLISSLDTAFPHCECVCELSERAFTAKYLKWCKKHGYNFSQDKALDIYASACGHVGVMPKTDTAKLLVEQAVPTRAASAALAAFRNEMQSLAASLPEYPVVMGMFGVGPARGPQFMAEIGDVRRFDRIQSLVAFAGADATPCQSGIFESKNRHISKRGSSRLRKTFFQVMSTLIQHAPADDPVFQFLDRKRREGKHNYVYMTAAANKFLRIYYDTAMTHLEKL